MGMLRGAQHPQHTPSSARSESHQQPNNPRILDFCDVKPLILADFAQELRLVQ